jgi:hypothetical protein
VLGLREFGLACAVILIVIALAVLVMWGLLLLLEPVVAALYSAVEEVTYIGT